MAEVVTDPQPKVAGLGLLTADDPSLLLVAELLREEIQAQTDARLAQRLQISLTTNRTTATGTGETDFDTLDDSNDEEEEEESDQLVSLRQQLDMIISTLSRSAIVGIAGSESAIMADSIRARQLSQQFEANTRKETMDHELAMVLQKEANEKKRERTGELDMEELLGKEKVQKLMTPTSTSTAVEPTGDADIIEGKGKGKGKARAEEDEVIIEEAQPSFPSIPDLPTCQICFDPCRPVSDPFNESGRAGTSDQLVIGMYLGERLDKHLACIDCLTTYIETKLNDNSKKAFPLHCHQCEYEVTDEDAGRIFGLRNLEGWHYRKLLDSQPPLFCPNRECSARILRDADMGDESQAECPACHKMLCVHCGVVWHSGYTCEQYQSLPVGEREPEDFALFGLAKDQGWSRCPGCRIVMEHISGCSHMCCQCGVESCYACGSLWSKALGKCSSVPSCALWEEQRLLSPDQRDAARLVPIPEAPRVQRPQGVESAPVAVAGAGEQIVINAHRLPSLEFLFDEYEPGPYGETKFSHSFRAHSRCGYCNLGFASTAELQRHLVNASHAVYICHDRFFRRLEHLDQHVQSGWGRHERVLWLPEAQVSDALE